MHCTTHRRLVNPASMFAHVRERDYCAVELETIASHSDGRHFIISNGSRPDFNWIEASLC